MLSITVPATEPIEMYNEETNSFILNLRKSKPFNWSTLSCLFRDGNPSGVKSSFLKKRKLMKRPSIIYDA